MNIKKAKITNEIIPPLLSLFNDYNINLRTRLKANSFFLSFDEKTKKTFNKFIMLSNERFKLMKSGGNLNHILSKQRNNYTKINNDIKKDILFTTSYPNIERKKLVQSVNILKSKEISSMREKLYETLRYHSIYDKKIKNHHLITSDDTIEEKIKKANENKNKNSNNHRKESNEQIELIQSKTEGEIKDDHDNFIKGLEAYKFFLKNKKSELNNKEDKIAIKIYKNDFNDIESHIKENNIKILTYKTKSSENKTKKKKEDTKFDINILYKIKNYNSKNVKNIFPKLKSIETDEDLLYDENLSSKNSKKLSNMKCKTFNNTDLKNTIGLINEEARNGIEITEKFNNQKKKFDKSYNTQFGIINYPKDFEKFENNKSQHIRATWREQRRSILPKKLTKIKNEENENEKIFEDFKKIYEQKKILWKKIDEENAKKKAKKEKDKEDVINYLFSIERNKSKK